MSATRQPHRSDWLMIISLPKYTVSSPDTSVRLIDSVKPHGITDFLRWLKLQFEFGESSNLQRFALAEIARMRAANEPAVGFAAGPVGRFTVMGSWGAKLIESHRVNGSIKLWIVGKAWAAL